LVWLHPRGRAENRPYLGRGNYGGGRKRREGRRKLFKGVPSHPWICRGGNRLNKTTSLRTEKTQEDLGGRTESLKRINLRRMVQEIAKSCHFTLPWEREAKRTKKEKKPVRDRAMIYRPK